MKFVITGGHHNSALVVAQEFIKKGHQVVWLGHQYAQTGDQNPSAEYLEVTAANIPFYPLKAGKSSLNSLPQVPVGIYQALKILRREKPEAVISFGSYLGLTTVLAAALLKIPIFLHEQTVVAGKANRFASPFARRIFLTWPQSQRYFPRSKSQVVGLPLRPSILHTRSQITYLRRQADHLPAVPEAQLMQAGRSPQPSLLILGGKQGSHFINQLIFQLLPQLASKFILHHQTGTSSLTQDLQQAKHLKQSLHLDHYYPHGYLTAKQLAPLLAKADLVISRSGAHTVYELAYLQKPAILIPYEFTHQKEQLRNARLLAQTGQAVILRQNQLTAPLLHQTILRLTQSPPTFKPLKLPSSATQVMVNTILNDLSHEH